MMARFPLFIDLVRNVEMALAKSDFGIAKLYSELVSDKALRERVYGKLKQEFERTEQAVLLVTGQKALLEIESGAGTLHPAAESICRSHEPDPGGAAAAQAQRRGLRCAQSRTWRDHQRNFRGTSQYRLSYAT